MEYWTIKDGQHAGPYTALQLADMGITPDTPVWHEGLTDWVAAREIAEIASIMVARQNGAAPVAPAPDQPCEPQQPQCGPQPEPQTQYGPQPREYGGYVQPQGAPARASHAPMYPEQPAAAVPEGECPPAYLAWSIVSLILCCIPLGVVAIIFSAQVKPAWRRGEAAKARRASERAQWCIILSMSLGLISQIFYGVFSGAAGL